MPIEISLPEITITGDQAMWRGWSIEIGSRERLLAALDAAGHQMPFEICLLRIAARMMVREVEVMSNHQRFEFEVTTRAHAP